MSKVYGNCERCKKTPMQCICNQYQGKYTEIGITTNKENKKLTPSEILRALLDEKILETDLCYLRIKNGVFESTKKDKEKWRENFASVNSVLVGEFTIYDPPKKLSDRFKEKFARSITVFHGDEVGKQVATSEVLLTNTIYNWLKKQEDDQ